MIPVVLLNIDVVGIVDDAELLPLLKAQKVNFEKCFGFSAKNDKYIETGKGVHVL